MTIKMKGLPLVYDYNVLIIIGIGSTKILAREMFKTRT